MKILFDHQIFTAQVYGGVSKYFCEIIRRLPKSDWSIPCFITNNVYVEDYKLFKHLKFIPQRNFYGKERILTELCKPYSGLRMLIRNYDVVHQTNFDDYLFPFIGKKPLVTTYHDINFLTDRNYNERMINLQTSSLKRADKVIAISNNTKNDMLDHFPFVNPENVTVIYHGIDKPTYNTDERVFDFSYILYVGARHLFKNFKVLAHAFSIYAQRNKNIHLVCTQNPFSNEEIGYFKKMGIEKRIHQIGACEEVLNRLYRDAECFVFPSKYEGFGMPILEAMVNNCPAILANASCFPEIAKSAALYFDPDSSEELAYKIGAVIEDDEIRNELINKGKIRVNDFSWDKCKNEHLKVYESLI